MEADGADREPPYNLVFYEFNFPAHPLPRAFSLAAAHLVLVRCMKRALGTILLVLVAFIAALFASAPLLALDDARRVAQRRSPIFCWSHWIGRDWEMLDAEGP